MNHDRPKQNTNSEPTTTVDPTESDVLVAAYVLGSAFAPEFSEAQRRLDEGDAAFQFEIQQALGALSEIARSVTSVDPPADAKSTLMRAITELERSRIDPSTAALANTLPKPGEYAAQSNVVDSDLRNLAVMLAPLRNAMPTGIPSEKPHKMALLVIDMLNDYVDGSNPMSVPLAQNIVPALKSRLQQERQRGTAIVYVNDLHATDDPDFRLWPPHAIQGTRGAEVLADLRPANHDYVVRRVSYSAFFQTNLDKLLDSLDVTQLVITGQAADACVMMTAVDALMRGFDVELPEECVAGLTPEGKTFALRRVAMLRPFQPRRLQP